MTITSTTAASSQLDRAPLWGMCAYAADGSLLDLPLGWADVERDVRWAETFLDELDIGAGSKVLVVSTSWELPWFGPFTRATTQLGATYVPTDALAFDAGRTAACLRRLSIDVVVGMNDAVAAGLESRGDLELLTRAGTIFARPDAQDRLRRAGIRPVTFAMVGPAAAVECPQGRVHVNGSEWSVDVHADGQLRVTTTGPREHRVRGLATGLYGSVGQATCPCGRTDPTVELAPRLGTGEEDRT